MSNKGNQDPEIETDGGAMTQAAEEHRDTDYLEQEVNILSPSTAFMRDHLRVVWTGFIVWALVVFGPVTLTAVAPGAMTQTMPAVGFPIHYFMAALGAPTGALLLSIWYARKRDALDEKYGINPSAPAEEAESAGEAAATDGGVEQ